MSNPSLYGQKPSKQSKTTDTPSSSNLAFTTTLSSLIASGSSDTTHNRTRPAKPSTSKSDIFSRPNKGASKRAAADLQDDDTSLRQMHQSSKDIGSVDAATLHRSKRRMEEKARQYEDLKRGLYLAGDSSDEDDTTTRAGQGQAYLARLRRKEKEGLVDFDRKWADAERNNGSDSSPDTDSSFEHTDDDEEDDDSASIISYEDELGRSRRGTRKDAVRAAKAKNEANGASETTERWRPSRPENLIYGAAVQTAAFQPTDLAAEQMAYLAKRRDRSPTPDEVHYDAEGEVRNRGTGFYAFSKDEETRKKQMEELLSARVETEKERDARRERRVVRERIKDDRRKEIEKLRAKRRAEMFLHGLGDMDVGVGVGIGAEGSD
ncbi:CCDC174 family protein [Aspergillus undulatus]|uniref:CCDC174 family protein n=1 Tax=Aspergillus undulatus TaxID=1810928 RepID=UPI003CCDEC51